MGVTKGPSAGWNRHRQKENFYKGRKPGTMKSKPENGKALKAKGLAKSENATVLGVTGTHGQPMTTAQEPTL
ncbi:MAG: hypothetical protein ACO3GX_03385 [Gemmataceae bacterium]